MFRPTRDCLCILLFGLLACSRPQEKTTIQMAVGGQTQFIYLPLTLANQLGYYLGARDIETLDRDTMDEDAIRASRDGGSGRVAVVASLLQADAPPLFTARIS